MKDWWKKKKAKKAAKKTAKADAKAENAAAKQLADTNVMTQPLFGGAPQALGNDTANRVYKTDNKANRAFGNGETTGYFKPDVANAPARNAVAASRMAQGLGMDDIIPETKFAQLATGAGGALETGAISANAKGESLQNNVFDTDITQALRDGGTDISAFKSGMNQKAKEVMNPQTGQMEKKVMTRSGTEMNDIDLSRPNTQSGLNRMQWFDALIGNQDRHGGNIVVDPTTGNVSGIDNDYSFDIGMQASFGDAFTQGDANYSGLPDMIDTDTAARLLALDDAKIKELLQTNNTAASSLGDAAKMTKKAVDQTIARLKVIQGKVRAIQADVAGGNLVQQWDQTTYDKQVNAPKHQGNWGAMEPNYIARQAAYITAAKDSKESAMWRKGFRDVDTPLPTSPQKDENKDSEGATEESETETISASVGDAGDSGADGGSEESSEEEKEQVGALVGEDVSVAEGLSLLDDLIAELEQLEIEMDGQTGDEKDAGPMAQTGGRPPVPNMASGGESESEEKDEAEARKARFRNARSKFANV